MSRLNQRRYEQHTLAAIFVYVAVLLLVLPLVRTASSIPFKVLLAVAPALPMLYVIWLMARRIRDSDELEQRMHLVALGAATAVVAACSLIGGFLAIAHVLPLDGSILIWVFPLMMLCYGTTRWWIARRYGGDLSCEGAMPMHRRLAIIAALMTIVGVFTYLRRDALDAGIFFGMAAGLALLAGSRLVTYAQRRRKGMKSDDVDA